MDGWIERLKVTGGGWMEDSSSYPSCASGGEDRLFLQAWEAKQPEEEFNEKAVFRGCKGWAISLVLAA